MKIEISYAKWIPDGVKRYFASLNWNVVGYSSETDSVLLVGKDADGDTEIEARVSMK